MRCQASGADDEMEGTGDILTCFLWHHFEIGTMQEIHLDNGRNLARTAVEAVGSLQPSDGKAFLHGRTFS